VCSQANTVTRDRTPQDGSTSTNVNNR